ncbi:MAG: transcriptional regulator, AsnC family [Gammaproteobacteria bacterium]|nr:transcriptional regulator, AsnC family [Gammaproteobacteria bacterium]
MKERVLDKVDLKILDLVQRDAKKSAAEIGEAVNLSQNACWRRINLLEEEGYIRSTVALLNAEKLGAGLTVFVSIKAVEHSEEWLKSFSIAVSKIKEVVEFYRMTGDVDYLLKLKVRDIVAYDAVYKRLIKQVRLTDVSSAFAMEEIKHTTCVPVSIA